MSPLAFRSQLAARVFWLAASVAASGCAGVTPGSTTGKGGSPAVDAGGGGSGAGGGAGGSDDGGAVDRPMITIDAFGSPNAPQTSPVPDRGWQLLGERDVVSKIW